MAGADRLANLLNPLRRLLSPWALVAAISAAYLALAYADGGYAPRTFAAATVVVWWALLTGLAARAWPRAPLPRTAVAAGACLAGFALLTAASIAWASDSGQAFAEATRAALYVGLFALVVVSSSHGRAGPWLRGLALGLLALTVLALLSRLEPSVVSGGREIAELIPGERERLSFPIGYWNGVGACAALAVVSLLWLGIGAATPAGRALAISCLPSVGLTLFLTGSRGGVLALVVGLIVLLAVAPQRARLLFGLGVGGAGTAVLVGLALASPDLVDGLSTGAAERQGHLLLLATLVIGAGTWLLSERLDRRVDAVRLPRPPRWALIGGGVLAVAVAIVVFDPGERLTDLRAEPPGRGSNGGVLAHLGSGTAGGRIEQWEAALDAFASAPLEGVGAGGYEGWWNAHGSIPWRVRDAHSLFLESLAELGIGGFALLMGFLGIATLSGLRRLRPAEGAAAGDPPPRLTAETGAALALIATGVTSASIDWMWELPAVFAPVVIAAALLAGAATGRPGEANPGLRSALGGSDAGGRGRWSWTAITVLVAGASIAAAAVLFLAETRLAQSRDEHARGDLSAAAEEARAAHDVEPWAAEPLGQLAAVQVQLGRLGNGLDAIRDAIERAPEDRELWLLAWWVELQLGKVEPARESLVQALELSPGLDPQDVEAALRAFDRDLAKAPSTR